MDVSNMQETYDERQDEEIYWTAGTENEPGQVDALGWKGKGKGKGKKERWLAGTLDKKDTMLANAKETGKGKRKVKTGGTDRGGVPTPMSAHPRRLETKRTEPRLRNSPRWWWRRRKSR